jgi:TolB-like protein
VNIAARLEGLCESGGVLISGAAYEHIRGRIDAEFVDLGEKDLKNIAGPVRVYALAVGSSNDAPAQTKPTAAPASEKSALPRLSIVVLPFANIGGDPSHEHFVDGVTESLTTDLSRIRGSFVIGRNTAFTYKGKPVDLKQIGRELNVRYVLEGSVQRGGNRMRVNVQLIDAESGSHLWAERFDKPLADLFDMQDEIVARLAGALNVQLIAAEARRAEKASNSDSMDLYFEGMAWFNRGLTRDTLARARICFDRAIIANRDNVDALIGSARTHVNAGAIGEANLRAAFLAAEAQSARALSLVPDDARGHMTLGVVYIYTRRAAQGIAECELRCRWIETSPKPTLISAWQKLDWSTRRNRNSHRRGPAPQSARYDGVRLDVSRGQRKEPTRPLGASGRVASTRDRGQPKFRESLYWLGRRARAARPARRGAFRGQSRSRAQAVPKHCRRAGLRGSAERQPDL